METANEDWSAFLGETKAQVFCASFNSQQPVIAFLNEKYELLSTFEELKTQGNVPSGYQRLIDNHFEQTPTVQNEIVLNRDHRLVGRALEQNTGSPLASVLRLMVWNALNAAGAAISRAAQQQQAEDLDWIADALWGKKE